MEVWILFLGMCIMLWLYLRRTYAKLSKSWLLTLSYAEEQCDRDMWNPDRQAEHQTKLQLLELTKDSYDQLSRPLEPFVAVFILFGIPACVMATDYCDERSQVHASSDTGVTIMSVGYCDVMCEFVLSFRSMATVAVYFYARENQNEVYHFRTMCRRLRSRVAGWFWSSERQHTRGVRSRRLDEVQRLSQFSNDIDEGDVDDTTGTTVPYELMVDDNNEGLGPSSRDTDL